jgi:iron(III) transport system substrate-binding protein
MRRSFNMNLFIGVVLAMLSFLCPAAEQEMLPYPPRGQVPPGYPTEYAATVSKAEDEGALVIYSTTDVRVAQYLIDDFRALYPKVAVDYHDLNSTELHYRFIAESQLGADSADIVWSSAMDQQFSLVNSGYAQPYRSPEIPKLPKWAVWNEQAFGTTYEPVVIAYNKRLLGANEVPQTRSDLIRLLNTRPERFKGKVDTYNIEKSGLGFFLAAQDANESQGFWDLARALGNAGVRLHLTTDAMLRRVASGRALIAYNVLGSYAVAEARKNPSVGYAFPKDYTLVTSRVMFINRKAKNPNAAKLWVDYVLSRRGQAVIANLAFLYAIRSDVEGEATASKLGQALGGRLKPIPIGPDLINYLDKQKYRDFVKQWRQATAVSK